MILQLNNITFFLVLYVFKLGMGDFNLGTRKHFHYNETFLCDFKAIFLLELSMFF